LAERVEPHPQRGKSGIRQPVLGERMDKIYLTRLGDIRYKGVTFTVKIAGGFCCPADSITIL
jgi:hypothetical protein